MIGERMVSVNDQAQELVNFVLKQERPLTVTLVRGTGGGAPLALDAEPMAGSEITAGQTFDPIFEEGPVGFRFHVNAANGAVTVDGVNDAAKAKGVRVGDQVLMIGERMVSGTAGDTCASLVELLLAQPRPLTVSMVRGDWVPPVALVTEAKAAGRHWKAAAHAEHAFGGGALGEGAAGGAPGEGGGGGAVGAGGGEDKGAIDTGDGESDGIPGRKFELSFDDAEAGALVARANEDRRREAAAVLYDSGEQLRALGVTPQQVQQALAIAQAQTQTQAGEEGAAGGAAVVAAMRLLRAWAADAQAAEPATAGGAAVVAPWLLAYAAAVAAAAALPPPPLPAAPLGLRFRTMLEAGALVVDGVCPATVAAGVRVGDRVTRLAGRALLLSTPAGDLASAGGAGVSAGGAGVCCVVDAAALDAAIAAEPRPFALQFVRPPVESAQGIGGGSEEAAGPSQASVAAATAAAAAAAAAAPADRIASGVGTVDDQSATATATETAATDAAAEVVCADPQLASELDAASLLGASPPSPQAVLEQRLLAGGTLLPWGEWACGAALPPAPPDKAHTVTAEARLAQQAGFAATKEAAARLLEGLVWELQLEAAGGGPSQESTYLELATPDPARACAVAPSSPFGARCTASASSQDALESRGAAGQEEAAGQKETAESRPSEGLSADEAAAAGAGAPPSPSRSIRVQFSGADARAQTFMTAARTAGAFKREVQRATGQAVLTLYSEADEEALADEALLTAAHAASGLVATEGGAWVEPEAEPQTKPQTEQAAEAAVEPQPGAAEAPSEEPGPSARAAVRLERAPVMARPGGAWGPVQARIVAGHQRWRQHIKEPPAAGAPVSITLEEPLQLQVFTRPGALSASAEDEAKPRLVGTLDSTLSEILAELGGGARDETTGSAAGRPDGFVGATFRLTPPEEEAGEGAAAAAAAAVEAGAGAEVGSKAEVEAEAEAQAAAACAPGLLRLVWIDARRPDGTTLYGAWLSAVATRSAARAAQAAAVALAAAAAALKAGQAAAATTEDADRRSQLMQKLGLDPSPGAGGVQRPPGVDTYLRHYRQLQLDEQEAAGTQTFPFLEPRQFVKSILQSGLDLTEWQAAEVLALATARGICGGAEQGGSGKGVLWAAFATAARGVLKEAWDDNESDESDWCQLALAVRIPPKPKPKPKPQDEDGDDRTGSSTSVKGNQSEDVADDDTGDNDDGGGGGGGGDEGDGDGGGDSGDGVADAGGGAQEKPAVAGAAGALAAPTLTYWFNKRTGKSAWYAPLPAGAAGAPEPLAPDMRKMLVRRFRTADTAATGSVPSDIFAAVLGDCGLRLSASTAAALCDKMGGGDPAHEAGKPLKNRKQVSWAEFLKRSPALLQETSAEPFQPDAQLLVRMKNGDRSTKAEARAELDRAAHEHAAGDWCHLTAKGDPATEGFVNAAARTYWYNKRTAACQWERPGEAQDPVAKTPGLAPYLHHRLKEAADGGALQLLPPDKFMRCLRAVSAQLKLSHRQIEKLHGQAVMAGGDVAVGTNSIHWAAFAEGSDEILRKVMSETSNPNVRMDWVELALPKEHDPAHPENDLDPAVQAAIDAHEADQAAVRAAQAKEMELAGKRDAEHRKRNASVMAEHDEWGSSSDDEGHHHHHPASAEAAAEEAAAAADEAEVESHHVYYWHNKRTGEASWAKPPELVEAEEVPPDVTHYLAHRFKQADADGSGDLDAHEFEWLLEHLDLDLSHWQVMHLMHRVDEDGDGVVSWSEFVHGAPKLIRRLFVEEGTHPCASTDWCLLYDYPKEGAAAASAVAAQAASLEEQGARKRKPRRLSLSEGPRALAKSLAGVQVFELEPEPFWYNKRTSDAAWEKPHVVTHMEEAAAATQAMAPGVEHYLGNMFMDADEDGSGALDEDEFFAMMRELALELTEKQITEIRDMIDLDHDGTITYHELLLNATSLLQHVQQEEQEGAGADWTELPLSDEGRMVPWGPFVEVARDEVMELYESRRRTDETEEWCTLYTERRGPGIGGVHETAPPVAPGGVAVRSDFHFNKRTLQLSWRKPQPQKYEGKQKHQQFMTTDLVEYLGRRMRRMDDLRGGTGEFTRTDFWAIVRSLDLQLTPRQWDRLVGTREGALGGDKVLWRGFVDQAPELLQRIYQEEHDEREVKRAEKHRRREEKKQAAEARAEAEAAAAGLPFRAQKKKRTSHTHGRFVEESDSDSGAEGEEEYNYDPYSNNLTGAADWCEVPAIDDVLIWRDFVEIAPHALKLVVGTKPPEAHLVSAKSRLKGVVAFGRKCSVSGLMLPGRKGSGLEQLAVAGAAAELAGAAGGGGNQKEDAKEGEEKEKEQDSGDGGEGGGGERELTPAEMALERQQQEKAKAKQRKAAAAAQQKKKEDPPEHEFSDEEPEELNASFGMEDTWVPLQDDTAWTEESKGLNWRFINPWTGQCVQDVPRKRGPTAPEQAPSLREYLMQQFKHRRWSRRWSKYDLKELLQQEQAEEQVRQQQEHPYGDRRNPAAVKRLSATEMSAGAVADAAAAAAAAAAADDGDSRGADGEGSEEVKIKIGEYSVSVTQSKRTERRDREMFWQTVASLPLQLTAQQVDALQRKLDGERAAREASRGNTGPKASLGEGRDVSWMEFVSRAPELLAAVCGDPRYARGVGDPCDDWCQLPIMTGAWYWFNKETGRAQWGTPSRRQGYHGPRGSDSDFSSDEDEEDGDDSEEEGEEGGGGDSDQGAAVGASAAAEPAVDSEEVDPMAGHPNWAGGGDAMEEVDMRDYIDYQLRAADTVHAGELPTSELWKVVRGERALEMSELRFRRVRIEWEKVAKEQHIGEANAANAPPASDGPAAGEEDPPIPLEPFVAHFKEVVLKSYTEDEEDESGYDKTKGKGGAASESDSDSDVDDETLDRRAKAAKKKAEDEVLDAEERWVHLPALEKMWFNKRTALCQWDRPQVMIESEARACDAKIKDFLITNFRRADSEGAGAFPRKRFWQVFEGIGFRLTAHQKHRFQQRLRQLSPGNVTWAMLPGINFYFNKRTAAAQWEKPQAIVDAEVLIGKKLSNEYLQLAFHHADTTHTGWFTRFRFWRVVRMMGMQLTDEDVGYLMKRLDLMSLGNEGGVGDPFEQMTDEDSKEMAKRHAAMELDGQQEPERELLSWTEQTADLYNSHWFNKRSGVTQWTKPQEVIEWEKFRARWVRATRRSKEAALSASACWPWAFANRPV
jgi:Ca2+-binding EF-hand superfamily protein